MTLPSSIGMIITTGVITREAIEYPVSLPVLRESLAGLYLGRTAVAYRSHKQTPKTFASLMESVDKLF